jgi:DNA polymerase IV
LAERLPARRLRIRLLGVGVSGLDRPKAVQLSLFPDPQHEQQTRLDEVSDQIREKFGGRSLQRALGMLHDVATRAAESDPDCEQ